MAEPFEAPCGIFWPLEHDRLERRCGPAERKCTKCMESGFEETADALRACGLYSEDELDFKNILVLKPMTTLLNRNGNTSTFSAAAEPDDEESCSPADADANETEELASLEMDLNEEDTDGELGKEKPVVCSQHAVDFK